MVELRSVACHIRGITQCYLPHNTDEHVPEPGRLS